MIEIKQVELTERELEAMLKENLDLIEEGLKFIDNQIAAGRRPLDILAVDSSNADQETSGNELLTTSGEHEL
ncbi:MAG: hypothetical protein ACE5II_01520 [Anaerolineae bacterium]